MIFTCLSFVVINKQPVIRKNIYGILQYYLLTNESGEDGRELSCVWNSFYSVAFFLIVPTPKYVS